MPSLFKLDASYFMAWNTRWLTSSMLENTGKAYKFVDTQMKDSYDLVKSILYEARDMEEKD